MQRLALVMPGLFVLAACSPAVAPASRSSLYVFRLDPPALVELDSKDQPAREIPVTVPGGCGLDDVFAPPRGARLALELSCPFGQAVLVLDTASGALHQPVTDSDSHFLAWSSDGTGLYLKVNSINRPQIMRIGADGSRTELPISELTYDLAPALNSPDFLFALSRGMGLGSELWFAQYDGRNTKQLANDPSHYLSLARWSPDGKQIAFIKIPDSPTPYTVGELWVMQADGSGSHLLAEADAGHGFAPAWAREGRQIAFVYRENATDANADQSADALISNIHAVSLPDGKEEPLTTFSGARVEAPIWQPDGNSLAFTVGLNDKMQVDVLDVSSGALRNVAIEPACCAAWVRK
jgi:hypothetical protein